MSKAIITESKLTAIANAIRTKTGSASALTVDEMATAISGMNVGGLKQCEWIANSGKSYIKTNIIPQSGDILSVDFQLSSVTGNPAFAGCANAESGQTERFVIQHQGSGEGYHYQCADKTWRNSSVVADTNRHIITFDSSGELLLDNETILTFSPNWGNVSHELTVFAKYWGAVSTDSSVYMKGKFFGVTLTRNGNAVMNLVPKYFMYDDTIIGMHDTVNDVFYQNAGAGSFTKGADV